MFNLHVIYLYQNFGARRRGRKESAATLGSAKAMSTTWEHEHGVLSSSFDVKPRKKVRSSYAIHLDLFWPFDTCSSNSRHLFITPNPQLFISSCSS